VAPLGIQYENAKIRLSWVRAPDGGNKDIPSSVRLYVRHQVALQARQFRNILKSQRAGGTVRAINLEHLSPLRSEPVQIAR
jgi:hypothetical protein